MVSTRKAGKQEGNGTSLEKALSIVSLVADSEVALRFADIEAGSGLPKATVHRLLAQLRDCGLLRFDESRQSWQLGFRLLEMAQQAWRQLDIRDLAHEAMQGLAELTGETVQLAVLADTQAIYVDTVESAQNVRLTARVGDKTPLHASALGKALLAALESDARRQLIERMNFVTYTAHSHATREALIADLQTITDCGFAREEEEHFAGVRAIAAPILDIHGHPIAAIGVAAPTFRVSDSQLSDWAPALIESARKISARLAPHSA